jgi:cyclopropane-fatty-acyl-phospholipid synthase
MTDLDDTLDPPEGHFAAAGAARGSLLERAARRGVCRLLNDLSWGRLQVQEGPEARVFGALGNGAPDVRVQIDDPGAYLDIATGGSIGAAEAYMAGKWRAHELTALIRILVRNRRVLDRMESGVARAAGFALKAMHALRANTRAGSRRNIRAHYDLGNDLFQLFLDPTLMYSSAVFPRPEATLDEAAVHKLDLICRQLDLRSDDHLLEIGTGWGGLALHAARNFGCRVTTTTISANQLAFARARVAAAGLSGRIEVVATDYRDLKGRYDKLVSVEMIEAVGLKFLGGYFATCSELLKPAGRMVLQAITIADRYYAQASRTVDFIQKYIFPGGALPSMRAMLEATTARTDLQLAGHRDIGLDYARTLQLWRERFLDRLEDVRRLGYPEEFIRMWEWYLCYCEGGFRERAISAVQLVFDKPECRLAPLGSTA